MWIMGERKPEGKSSPTAASYSPRAPNICCFSAPSRSGFVVFQIIIERKRGDTPADYLKEGIIRSRLSPTRTV